MPIRDNCGQFSVACTFATNEPNPNYFPQPTDTFLGYRGNASRIRPRITLLLSCMAPVSAESRHESARTRRHNKCNYSFAGHGDS
jgi:hypothetical protein